MRKFYAIRHRPVVKMIGYIVFALLIYHCIVLSGALIYIYSVDIAAHVPSQESIDQGYLAQYLNRYPYRSEVCNTWTTNYETEIEEYCFKINSQGIIADKEYSLTKEKPRIIVLGDSYTQGKGVEMEKNYPSRLQTLLPEYEIINLGLSGYNTYLEVKRFEQIGLQFDPDIIIVQMLDNDIINEITMGMQRMRMIRYLDSFTIIGILPNKERVLRVFATILANRHVAYAKTHAQDVVQKRIIDPLTDLRGMSNATMIILSFTLLEEQRKTIDKFCQNTCYHIDLKKEVDYDRDKMEFRVHETDSHPSAYLHELVAYQIASTIKKIQNVNKQE